MAPTRDRNDKLHFHPSTYVEFARIIKPVLEHIWTEVESTQALPPKA